MLGLSMLVAAVFPPWNAVLLLLTDVGGLLAFVPWTRWIVGGQWPVVLEHCTRRSLAALAVRQMGRRESCSIFHSSSARMLSPLRWFSLALQRLRMARVSVLSSEP